MKKKGLIIATIVMVLVLAVSLTTATYAWFTVANVTTIDGFDVSVTNKSALVIGVKQNSTYEATPNADMFRSGAIKYTAPGTAGTFGGGTWEGDMGFGPSIDHEIKWGAQTMAVGATKGTVGADPKTEADKVIAPTNTGLWNYADATSVIAANGNNQASITDAQLAVANTDYAYMFLGVKPATTLNFTDPTLVIMLDGTETTGSTVGILAAVHVAYRINGGGESGEWTDVDLCGSVKAGDAKASLTHTLTTTEQNAYVDSYTEDPTKPATCPTQAVALSLPLSFENADSIVQIELVIYIAGADEDCRNDALNAKGSIKIFFSTKEAQG